MCSSCTNGYNRHIDKFQLQPALFWQVDFRQVEANYRENNSGNSGAGSSALSLLSRRLLKGWGASWLASCTLILPSLKSPTTTIHSAWHQPLLERALGGRRSRRWSRTPQAACTLHTPTLTEPGSFCGAPQLARKTWAQAGVSSWWEAARRRRWCRTCRRRWWRCHRATGRAATATLPLTWSPSRSPWPWQRSRQQPQAVGGSSAVQESWVMSRTCLMCLQSSSSCTSSGEKSFRKKTNKYLYGLCA